MKRILLIAVLCLGIGGYVAAQQNPADAPATKEEIQKYLQIMHSREMMTKMVEAMSKPMHQMMHDQYLKDKANLPADFEVRMNKKMDEMFKSFPWDEMLDAMVPVYQKHFTKGDVDALMAFYSTATGQKLIKEMPAITAEAMQEMMPLMRKSMDQMTRRMQEEIAAMVRESESKNGKTGTQITN
ncbi:MAG TPA: DUF2059 domain-containing protein [Candidatus Acidoferrales bacterium]|jgi:hypothetical protein|nr:DUF2059 domain-containing protein [Candidatus Acidoferrales bacterium]